MAIFLCDDELQAMAGLPHSAIVLYLGIRQRMDIATGLVGVKARISWQALREDCYVEPHSGLTETTPHISTLRRLAGWLERAGLVKQHGDRDKRQLFFKCLLASRPSYVQKQPDSNPTDQADTPKSAPIQDFSQQADRPEQAQPDIHRSSEYTYRSKHSSSSTVVEGQDDDDAMESPKNPETPNPVEFWPSSLSEQDRQAIGYKLAKVKPERRQQVVDELAGFMGRSAKPVSNPVRYVDFIIEKAAGPIWLPEHAARVKAGRDQAMAIRQQAATPPPADTNALKGREVVSMAADILRQFSSKHRATS